MPKQMLSKRNVEELLAQNQQMYLDREIVLMQQHTGMSAVRFSEILAQDSIHRLLVAEEMRLLELRDGKNDFEIEDLFRSVFAGRDWERRKKLHGKVDGDRQPNKVRFAKRRVLRRLKRELFFFDATC